MTGHSKNILKLTGLLLFSFNCLAQDACLQTLQTIFIGINKNSLNLVYSNDLIQPWMLGLKSQNSPKSIDDINSLILPYGLSAETGPGNTVLIVKKENTEALSFINYTGKVVDKNSGGPIHNAEVKLGDLTYAKTAEDGCFLVVNTAIQPAILSITAEGYQSHTLPTPSDRFANTYSFSIQLEGSFDDLPLDEIIIDATRHKLMYIDTTAPYGLDQKDFLNTPGASTDANSAILFLPGVAFYQAASQVFIRGGAANEVNTYIDGIELFNGHFLREWNGGISSVIDTNFVDNIDVLSGGYTAKYGNAMSGHIRVNTANVDTFPTRSKLAIGVLGNFDARTGFTYAEGLGETLVAYRRGVSIHPSEGKRKVVNLPKGRPEFEQWYSKNVWYLSESTTIRFSTLSGLDRSNIQYNLGDNVFNPKGKSRRDIAWLSASTDWNQGITSQSALSYGVSRRDRTVTEIADSTRYLVVDDSSAKFIGLQSDWSILVNPNFFMEFGFRAREMQSRYDYYRSASTLPASQGAQNISLKPEGRDMDFYFSNRFSLADNLIVEAGLRWDSDSFSPNQLDDELSPRLNLLYQINPKSQVRISWGEFNQDQDIYELQVRDGETDYQPTGSSRQVSVGYLYQINNNKRFRLDIFRKDYTQVMPRYENATAPPLEIFSELGADRIRIAPETATAYGFEFGLNGIWGENFTWAFNYTFSKAFDTRGDEDFRRSWDRRQAYNFSGQYTRGNWEFGFVNSYRSPFPRSFFEIIEAEDGGEVVEQRVLRYNQEEKKSEFDIAPIISYTWKLSGGQSLRGYLEWSELQDYANMRLEWNF